MPRLPWTATRLPLLQGRRVTLLVLCGSGNSVICPSCHARLGPIDNEKSPSRLDRPSGLCRYQSSRGDKLASDDEALFFACAPRDHPINDLARCLDAAVSGFNRIDLLSAVAGLQLLPENAERIVRLEALAYRIASVQSNRSRRVAPHRFVNFAIRLHWGRLPTRKTPSTASSAKRCPFMAARTEFCLGSMSMPRSS